MNQEEQWKEQGKAMSQLIAKCWADEGYKQRLLADPASTLKAGGVEVPRGLSVKAVENTDTVVHLVIPAKPTDLSDDELDKVSAGWCVMCDSCIVLKPPAGPPGYCKFSSF
jgi:hypothetical protein